ncbi:MAG: MBL fold metallo-hydrolase [Muribaculaceae bacterium]|nr:MBL fold metallo-hydrolase [Muribaculaceae bacterium]
MKIQSFEFNLFGVNTYIIFDTNTCEAAIVDPGMTTERECARIDSYIESNGLHVKYLINTHMHIDHLFGDEYIAKKYGTGISASTDDSILSERIAEQARMFHLRTDMPDSLNVDMPLHDGDRLMLGAEPIDVLAVPGHSPGSIALYCPESKFVVTGDALFKNSIGRTDLPGGSYEQLISSITKRLLTLPPDTTVYPGHGPSTTIESELRHNPFL